MNRLVLFDIDGTLLTTNGAAKRAFHRALLEVYSTAGPIATHAFDGKTDPQIARELLSVVGLTDAAIDRQLDRLWACYLRYLADELATTVGVAAELPGVSPLLDALAARPDVCIMGLLTGNVERGAALKLGAAGLAGRFGFGAYGSDHERRTELPAIAIARARAVTGRAFAGTDVVIVGDTPHDVACGRSLGVRAIGVATGRFSPGELFTAGADFVLDDFRDTAAAAAALLH